MNKETKTVKIHRYISRGPFQYRDEHNVRQECEHVFVLKRMVKDSKGKDSDTGDYRCEKCSLKRYSTVV